VSNITEQIDQAVMLTKQAYGINRNNLKRVVADAQNASSILGPNGIPRRRLISQDEINVHLVDTIGVILVSVGTILQTLRSQEPKDTEN
jgi:hypothetical protein